MSLAAAGQARSDPEGLALCDERGPIGWARLDLLLNRATNRLMGARSEEARRIGFFATNSGETVVAYLAALLAGLSAVPINFHLTADEAVHMLTDAEVGVLFVGPETAAVGLAAARKAGVGTVVGWRCASIRGITPWETWIATGSPEEPAAEQSPEPFLHYTSGTTGQPKGVETPPTMFPRCGSVAEFFEAMRRQVEDLPPGPGLAVGPLYHTGPLGSVRQLAGGKPLVVMERFDAERVLETVQRHRVSSTVMAPTHFQRLLALPPDIRAQYDVSSLRMVAHTGAACPSEVKREMIDWFGPILLEAYGGTEAGTTNMITSEEWLRKPGSVGKTIAPFELLVADDQGGSLGVGEIGRLCFRDTSGRGIVYHNDPEKTRAAHLAPGVFTLGEVGYVDEEGYVFITDRVSDMIVSGGVNIYPAEIEAVLIQHPDVLDVAVIGVPGAAMGEDVKALVLPARIDAPPSVDDLLTFCRRGLAGYKCPRSIDFVADLGRNAMGKINKRALKRPYWPTERMIGG